MKQYRDIDILSFLEEQMRQNTRYYQDNFEIDKKIFARAAASENPEDKTIFWMSRTHGTNCVKEHDVFIQDTSAHKTWCYYGEQTNENVVAFAVEVKGEKQGVIKGNVYEMDYLASIVEVEDRAVKPLKEVHTFEDGFEYHKPFDRSNSIVYSLMEEHGPVKETRTVPADEKELAYILADDKENRNAMKVGNLHQGKPKKSVLEKLRQSEKEAKSRASEKLQLEKKTKNKEMEMC